MTDHAPDDEIAQRRAQRDAATEREADRRARALAAIAALRQQLKETPRR